MHWHGSLGGFRDAINYKCCLADTPPNRSSLAIHLDHHKELKNTVSMKLVPAILLGVVFGAFQATAQDPLVQSVIVLTGNDSCPTPVEQLYVDALNNKVMTLYCHNFRSINFPDYSLGVVGGNRNSIVVNANAHQWHFVQPGWSGQPGSVSLQSCADARRYMRVRRTDSNFVYEDIIHDTDPMSTKEEATFYWRQDYWFQGYDVFESVYAPNNFVRHAGFVLHLHPYDNGELFRNDASFIALPQGLYGV